MPPARIAMFAATAAGVALSARAVVSGPPPLPVAVFAVVAYLALLLSGVFVLRLQMFADAVVRGPEGARGVVLTFDDGPHPEHTRQVLDLLERHGAKATFFVIGAKALRHPELVAEIVRRGHEVGVHGFSHDRLFSLRSPSRVEDDLARAIRTLEDLTGDRPRIFRPPIGHTNPTIARIAHRFGLTVVGWSVAGRDGVRTRPEAIVRRVRRGLEDGAIVLLHDAAERDDRRPAVIAALPGIFDAIAEKNLRVVPLGAWLEE
jgi:peptidoglycan-N-acetylglucosamine deacetylase